MSKIKVYLLSRDPYLIQHLKGIKSPRFATVDIESIRELVQQPKQQLVIVSVECIPWGNKEWQQLFQEHLVLVASLKPNDTEGQKALVMGAKAYVHAYSALVQWHRVLEHVLDGQVWLGLPEDLLPNTPHSIFNHMITYAGTLRDGYDEETCGALVRSTMSAYRPQDRRITSRIYNQVETSFSKVYFRRVFLRGSDKSKAQEMGVEPNALDYLLSGAASAYITPQIMAHLAALKIPVVEGVADKILVRRLKRLLREYGHPEYITDAANYVEVNPRQTAASGASQSKREASWVT